MPQGKRITLVVNEEAIDRLREIADSLGYISEHGMTAGAGNLSGMCEAIAAGRLEIVPHGTSRAVKMLREALPLFVAEIARRENELRTTGTVTEGERAILGESPEVKIAIALDRLAAMDAGAR